MAYRQPIPSWRARQIAQHESQREHDFQQNVVGPIMGLGDAEDDLDDPKPIDGVEHHRVGKQFILAGNAVFTVVGTVSRFTFRVRRVESENPRYPEPTFFASVLTGSNNETSYSYVGILNARTGEVRFTKGSKIDAKAPAAIALTWTLARIWSGRGLPAGCEIYHEGRCGRCGRALTVPESIRTGFGPECADILGVVGDVVIR